MDKYKSYSDRQLIQAILAGEKGADEYLMTALMLPVIRILLNGKFRELPVERDEVCSELYIKLCDRGWKILSDFRYGSSLRTYLSHILIHHLCRCHCNTPHDRLNKGRVSLNDLTLEVADHSIKIESRYDAERLSAEILRCVKLLKENKQLVIRRWLEGYSDLETAEELKMTTGNIQTIRFRAFEDIRKLIKIKRDEI